MATGTDEEMAGLLLGKVRLEKELEGLHQLVRAQSEQLREERAALAERYDVLSAEAMRLKQDRYELHRKLSKIEVEKESIEREHSEQRERWAAQLDQASREFESMRSALVAPSELEAMRARIAEDAEAPWRDRCRTLESQLEVARAAQTSAQRDAERRKAALESASHEHRANMREAEAQHETAMAELAAKIEFLQGEQLATKEPMERVRRVQRENNDLNVRIEKLLEEVHDLRHENEALRASREGLLHAHARAQGEEQAAARLVQSERESLQRRVAHLTQELEAANAAQDRLQEANLRQESEMRGIRAALDDAQHALASEHSAAALRLAEGMREVERLKLEMDRRHAEGLRREAALQRSREELASTFAQFQRDAASELARVRDEEQAKQKRLEGEKNRLQEQLVSQHSQAAAAAASAQDRLDASRGECAAIKAELHGLSLERTAAVEEANRQRRRLGETEERVGSLSAELNALRHEHTETMATVRALQESESSASIALERETLGHDLIKKQLAKVQEEARAEEAAAENRFKQARRVWARERQQLRQAEAIRAKQVQALRGELERLRAQLAEPSLRTLDATPSDVFKDLQALVKGEQDVQAEIKAIRRTVLSASN